MLRNRLWALVSLLAFAVPAVPVGAQAPTAGPAAPVAPGSVLEFGTMWTFDAPPVEYWKARYGFAPDQAWLDHLRLATIRLPGCSSSFVSEDGLVMTNHHCARRCVADVSPPEKNYLETGFVAASRAEEVRCPGMYVDQLVAIEDVTAKVRAAVTASSPEEQVAQRGAVIEQLQAECRERTGLTCQVVSFYNGGMYSLYTYRRYDDLRLVMAPELQAAHFGGDLDNFTYPRYAVDVAFLRAYENGEPVRPEHFLEWSEAGATEGEPVFVVGNPGSTGRLLTYAQLEYLRDVDYPARLEDVDTRLAIMRDLASRSEAARRRYENAILGMENTQKAMRGYHVGVKDSTIMARKRAFEEDFRSRINADPTLRARYGGAWDAIASAQADLAAFAAETRYFGFSPSPLSLAASLVRLPQQAELPDSLRLPGWRGKAVEIVRNRLLRDIPADTALDRLVLAAWLTTAVRDLGADHALVRTLLGGKTPEAAAAALVAGTRLYDRSVREELVKGGAKAIERSKDPLIVAIRKLEPTALEVAERATRLNATIASNSSLIGEAIFAAYGTALPPDATFTPRISDGVVKGFPMNGTVAPYRTSLYGLYARATEFDHKSPFNLAPSWQRAQSKVDMTTPVNFVSTNDIIGGNSGSPVVNRAGEVVGLVFDGNIEMLPNRFIFTDEVSRAVSVHSQVIIEALRKVYDANHIADEIVRR